MSRQTEQSAPSAGWPVPVGVGELPHDTWALGKQAWELRVKRPQLDDSFPPVPRKNLDPSTAPLQPEHREEAWKLRVKRPKLDDLLPARPMPLPTEDGEATRRAINAPQAMPESPSMNTRGLEILVPATTLADSPADRKGDEINAPTEEESEGAPENAAATPPLSPRPPSPNGDAAGSQVGSCITWQPDSMLSIPQGNLLRFLHSHRCQKIYQKEENKWTVELKDKERVDVDANWLKPLKKDRERVETISEVKDLLTALLLEAKDDPPSVSVANLRSNVFHRFGKVLDPKKLETPYKTMTLLAYDEQLSCDFCVQVRGAPGTNELYLAAAVTNGSCASGDCLE